MTQKSAGPEPRRRSGGPHPGVVMLVASGLTVLAVAVAVGAGLSDGVTFGSPSGAPGDVLQRYRDLWPALRISAWLQTGSAIPLLIATAAFFARQQRLGIRVPGPVIGLVGGVLAGSLLVVSGVVGWALSRPEVLVDGATVQLLATLASGLGGVGSVLGIGLLVAGVAVPALILRLVPRWLAVAGLAIAACAELAFLAMVLDPFQVLVPAGRFLGLAWLVVAGFLLPVDRAPRNAHPARGGRREVAGA